MQKLSGEPYAEAMSHSNARGMCTAMGKNDTYTDILLRGAYLVLVPEGVGERDKVEEACSLRA